MQTLNRVWSQVIAYRNLNDESDTQVKTLNEGFADWFASQVSGGTDYFTTEDYSCPEGTFLAASRSESVSGLRKPESKCR